MKIRKAIETDAQEGSEVLKRSIIELCKEDHASDPDRIAAWTANKTAETWLSWVRHPNSSLYVAEENGRIIGVCMLNREGEILLNYVSPDARFSGVSKAMLEHMETEASAKGIQWCTLESTKTACTFYRSAGYDLATGAPPSRLKMRKRLGRIGGQPPRAAIAAARRQRP